jgi:hypothetical protein
MAAKRPYRETIKIENLILDEQILAYRSQSRQMKQF